MKIAKFATTLALTVNVAAAEGQQVFTCVSDVDGQEIIAKRPAESDKGTVVFHKTEGDATVLHGLDGVTFLHIAGEDVWTLSLHLSKMTYELSAHGTEVFEDHGTCTAP